MNENFDKSCELKMTDNSSDNDSNKDISGINSKVEERPGVFFCVFRILFGVVFLFVFLFVCAGTLNWQSGWFYFVVNAIYLIASVPLMYKYNPEMLKRKFPKDTKRFDKIFLVLYVPLFYSEILIGSLDERFDWSGDFTLAVVLVGSIVYGFAFMFWLWAVVTNRNFELTVRIQKDRGHKVCSTGPYRFVRHPAYVAGILMFVSTPVALSTYWGFIPAGILVVALLIRTLLEDKMLSLELDGYREFMQKTRYRLIPFVW